MCINGPFFCSFEYPSANEYLCIEFWLCKSVVCIVHISFPPNLLNPLTGLMHLPTSFSGEKCMIWCHLTETNCQASLGFNITDLCFIAKKDSQCILNCSMTRQFQISIRHVRISATDQISGKANQISSLAKKQFFSLLPNWIYNCLWELELHKVSWIEIGLSFKRKTKVFGSSGKCVKMLNFPQFFCSLETLRKN